MNDTTLPIKKSPTSTPSPRIRKFEGVKRGFGLHDWMNLLRRTSDLAQRRGAPLRRSIPMSEVRAHSSEHDAWIVLRGKVYNITPYLHYHPGGLKVMSPTLGRDATKVFDKFHSWVNIEGLVGVLLLGYVAVERKGKAGVEEEGLVLPSGESGMPASSSVEFAMPAPRPGKNAVVPSLLSPADRDGDDSDDDEDMLLG